MHILLMTNNPVVYRQIEALVPILADDQPVLQQITASHEVQSALLAGHHDIALLDCDMDGGRGLDILTGLQVKDLPRPVIVLCTDPSSPERQQALRAGVDDLLHLSTLDAPLLAFRIQKAFEHRRLANLERNQHTFIKAVKDSTVAANSPLELEQLLNRIISSTQHIVHHDASNVMLLEAESAHVVHFQGYKQPASELVMAQPIASRPDLQRILSSARPLLIVDSTSDPEWTTACGPAWVRSHIGLPLILRNEVIGVLNLESRSPASFTPNHVTQLAVFAEQISSAIHNSRLRYEGEKRRQELETLIELTSVVNSTLNLDTVMELLLGHLNNVVPYDSVSVLLADKDSLEVVACRGVANTDYWLGRRVDPQRYALIQELARTRQPLCSPDASSDPRFKDWDILSPRRGWMGIPLLAHGVMIGCMFMDSNQARTYGKPESALVSSFANQAALAIHNAQLYEELRRYASELESRVTERTAELMTTNEALQRSEERYRTLFGATFEGICVHEDGWLLETNQAFRQLFGYSEAEMENMHILKLVDEASREIILSKIRAGNETPYEATGVRKDGATFPAEILGKKHSFEGRTVRVAAMRDLTDHKAKERHQLDLALERERTQILTRFISQASHEFRTPLTIINVNAAILKRIDNPQTISERVDLIQEQVKHISTLVANMLTLSTLDDKQNRLPSSVMELNALVETTRPHALSLAEKKQITVVYDLIEQPLVCNCSSDYLKQAISLLIDNACSYTPSGGSVTVRTRLNMPHAIIEVADTGPGINPEHMPHIFERFFRADLVGTTRGFGLGLSIVRVVIERHNGWIEVDNQPGAGCTFRLLLPLR